MPDLLQLQQEVSFSPCRAHRLHLHLWWSTSRRHQQFMLHLRLSWCTSRWHKQCLTPRKHKYWSTSRLRLQPLPDLLRLQQGAQFSPCRAHRLHLHLWWSTSRRHQQFILHLRLSWCTSRWHKQCLTPRKHKYWSTSRLRLQPTRPTTCSTSCVVSGYRTRASASHQQNRGHRPCNLSLYVVPPHSRFPLATLHLQRCCFGLPCLRVLKKQLS